MLRLGLHLPIALTHRLGHFALTHIFTDHRIAWVQGPLDTVEDILKICLAAAEARRPEQEYFFVSQLCQQLQGGAVRVSLIRPEPDVEHFTGGHFRFRRTVAILAQALADGKQVAVPKVYGEDMKFILLPDLTRVSKGYAGIPEPVDDGPVATDTQALVLMPGLVFDKAGHRIGYGGGFYDRFLSREPDHPTVALCYDFQVMEKIETESFDIPVDVVLWA